MTSETITNNTVTSETITIDTKFIIAILGELEGKGRTKGYVPARNGQPLGASGVTIATGIDLGQQNLSQLRALNLPDDLAARLAPYLGAKGREAQYLLAREPLLLSTEEVTLLDEAVHKRYIDETAALFGRERFASAPKEAQAVATSLHYQFGTPARKASPALSRAWSALRAGDYLQAAESLRDPAGWSASHRQYMARRDKEAALLLNIRL